MLLGATVPTLSIPSSSPLCFLLGRPGGVVGEAGGNLKVLSIVPGCLLLRLSLEVVRLVSCSDRCSTSSSGVGSSASGFCDACPTNALWGGEEREGGGIEARLAAFRVAVVGLVLAFAWG